MRVKAYFFFAFSVFIATGFASDQANVFNISRKSKKKSYKRAQTPSVTAPLARSQPTGSAAALAARPGAVINSSWNGGTGNWNVSSDWTPGTNFPNNGGGNTYNVSIGTGSDVVNLNTNVTISSLTVGATFGSSLLQNLSNTAESLNDLGTLTLTQAGSFYFNNGSTLTVGSGMTNSGTFDLVGASIATITGNVTNSAVLRVDDTGNGGSTFTNNGSLTNNSYMQVGNYYMTSPSTGKITGTLTNSGPAVIQVNGGAASGSNALLNVTGAAPGTLTGTYEIASHVGSAAVEWGSGGITTLGDGSGNAGVVALSGASAYMETGATNSNSALKSLTTIAGNGELQVQNGATVTTTGALANAGILRVDDAGTGGSSLTIGGNLTNTDYFQVGNYYMTSGSTTKVNGTVNNSGTLLVNAGNAPGANALLNITAAAPSTLTGTYQVNAYAGSAAIEWGSGAITSIGDGASSPGALYLSGTLAYAETGATNSNSAIRNLSTVASNGYFDMQNGAVLTTTGALSNNGQLRVDDAGSGGSNLTIGGALANSGYMQLGGYYMTTPSNAKVTGALTNTGTLEVSAGNTAGANALLNITGAAPSTLTGTYQVYSYAGSAAVEFGSGTIANIGDGASNAGAVYLSGSQAYMETGATNSNSALRNLATIATNGYLSMQNGAALTTTGALSNSGQLRVDDAGTGGSNFTAGGALTNTSYMQVGNYYMTNPSNAKVTGVLNNGGTVQVNAGNTLGANTLLNVTGAAPATLSGTYQIYSYAGSGAIEWGSGAITSIGNASTGAGSVSLYGSQAYMETGATNSNSALKTLNTIASNGYLELQTGAVVTTTGALNNSGQLRVDDGAAGGSNLTLGGPLTNSNYFQVGNYYMTSASNAKVTGTMANTGVVQVNAGNTLGANALLNVTGAAPSTLTGTYQVNAAAGSAAVEWGSGGITKIGDGASGAGSVTLSGALAYLEKGATNSNSALSGLATISNNGTLLLENGASVTSTAALTNGGQLSIDPNGSGGSTYTVKGAFTNNNALLIGDYYDTSASAMNATSTFANGATGTVNINPGNTAAGTAMLNVTGSSITNGGIINLNASAGESLLNIAAPAFSNAGTINLIGNVADATLEISANTTLSGAGTINLSNTTTNLVTGSTPTVTFTNGSTIQGSGTISNMKIVNSGKMIANQSTPLLILPASGGLTNSGTLSVLTGDTMQVGTTAGGALTNYAGNTLTGGTYSVGGTLQFGAPGTSIVTDAANISLTGAGARIVDFSGASVLTNLATITSAGSLTFGNTWGNFTTTGNFTNNGVLTVGASDKFIVNLAHSLTNFAGTTLTGGTYKITGTLQFAGANIVTNAANITLTGANSKIVNQSNANGLANFAVNNAGASFTLGTGRSFTTAGNFTNNGSLVVGGGDTFKVNGNLTNFSGTTLAGGAYTVSGILQFNGANIVTNAANITLNTTAGKIVNQSGVNAMLGFNTNAAAGKFTLSGNANLTTTGGSFTNAGLFTVSTGSTFTVGGSGFNFTQTAGTATIDGTLAAGGAGNFNLSGGSLFGNGAVNYSVVDTGIVSPGESVAATGKLAVGSNYTQSSAGTLSMTIGGTTAGTKYDQLNVSGTASLNGTLNISLASGFTPTVGSTFDILNASSIGGNFSTINGLSINSTEHFSESVSGNEIILTVVSGPAGTTGNVTHLLRPGVVHPGHGRQVATGMRPVMAPVSLPGSRPIAAHVPVSRGFRPMDEFAATAPAPVAAVPGGAPAAGMFSAPALNPMAAMNHLRFECGVDVNALLKTSPRRLLRALWAAPESPQAVSVGYMSMTPAR